ncbi:hypothetical protein FBU59_006325 [Linderina macrospora]|uniref:Uncharacterized protein n=1 Tax=Linderina macrospora TaxID=4868 RepID=A0ACC1J059_9FUNG|nr:hypothetical protein FBU59_006325 [Linderina macrospora]
MPETALPLPAEEKKAKRKKKKSKRATHADDSTDIIYLNPKPAADPSVQAVESTALPPANQAGKFKFSGGVIDMENK